MLILRVLAFLVVIAVGASITVFLFTRDRRYLRFAWQVFKYSIILALLIFALLAIERLVLVV